MEEDDAKTVIQVQTKAHKDLHAIHTDVIKEGYSLNKWVSTAAFTA